jgi:hypothetical protein
MVCIYDPTKNNHCRPFHPNAALNPKLHPQRKMVRYPE